MITAKNLAKAQIRELLDILRRSPGATEAGVRSCLRSEYGDSSALDAALSSGQVERRGHKLYAIDKES